MSDNRDYKLEVLGRTQNIPGDIACMGIYRGGTLVCMSSYLAEHKIDKKIYAFDSFKGFPPYHKNDLPEMFEKLYAQGEISQGHYLKAKVSGLYHLSPEKWADCSKEPIIVFLKDNGDKALIFEGMFVDTLDNLPDILSMVLLDCDLYESYLISLEYCYPRMSRGGVIYLDEYYSLKYPGARVAVNEFFQDKIEKPERLNEDKFERWCVQC